MTDKPQHLRLEIKDVIARAERVGAVVRRDLPTHDGLAYAAERVAAAARTAERVSEQMKRPLSLHRLPALFLALALLFLAGWVYWQFFHISELTIALPDRDATLVREAVEQGSRVKLTPVVVPGSREAVIKVTGGTVDLAFVQGGVPIPHRLPRLETPSPELVLWFVREEIQSLTQVDTILTSSAGEGSHTVAEIFRSAWGLGEKVQYLHHWTQLTGEDEYVIPPEVDAVFVVKDPGDEKTLFAAARLWAAGFRLRSPDIGARAKKLDFLKPTTVPRGYLQNLPPFPEAPVETYAVSTFLVAREGLTPRLLAAAGHIIDSKPTTIAQQSFELTADKAGALFQGVDAFLGMVINIGLAFLALLGIETVTYRKRFHELNSLISLLSMLQSNKDMLGLSNPQTRAENLLYLGLCSDLLGLISAISGYYTQENSSLLFNNLSEVIHQRCDGMKINIQIKVLHATIDTVKLLSPDNTPAADSAAETRPDDSTPVLLGEATD